MLKPTDRQTYSRALILLLVLPAILCAFHPAGAVDWKRPLTWIPDRFKPPGMAGEPDWERVLIWHEELGRKRGIRVALMPLIENEQNVPIDRRMTIQMKGYMLNFCDAVITVLDIEDPDLRDRLDEALYLCIRQWKRQGRIDPRAPVVTEEKGESLEGQWKQQARIEPETVQDVLSYFAVDVVVLFERSLYHQGWRGDRKVFRVGVLGAAFAVDTGDMIFLHEAVEECPFSGMQNTIPRVERLAIRSFLERFYNRLVAIATEIDAERAAALEAARQAAERQERERLVRLAREEEEQRRLAAAASEVLSSATAPRELLGEIRRAWNSVSKHLQRPSAGQTNGELEARRKAAEELRMLLAEQRKYAAEQERQSRRLPRDRPLTARSDLPGSEEPPVGGLLIRFATPSVTPASSPLYYLPPGAFDRPPRPPRRAALLPLWATMPSPTPTPTPPSRRALTPPEFPTSATDAVPASATAKSPFPASVTVVEPTGTVSAATPPIIAPASED